MLSRIHFSLSCQTVSAAGWPNDSSRSRDRTPSAPFWRQTREQSACFSMVYEDGDWVESAEASCGTQEQKWGRKERTNEMLTSPEPAAKKQKMQLVDLLEGQKRLKTCESTRNKMLQDLSFLQQVQLCHKVAQLQLSLQEARKLDLVVWRMHEPARKLIQSSAFCVPNFCSNGDRRKVEKTYSKSFPFIVSGTYFPNHVP